MCGPLWRRGADTRSFPLSLLLVVFFFFFFSFFLVAFFLVFSPLPFIVSLTLPAFLPSRGLGCSRRRSAAFDEEEDTLGPVRSRTSSSFVSRPFLILRLPRSLLSVWRERVIIHRRSVGSLTRSARIYFRRARGVLLRLVPRDMLPSLVLSFARLITELP